MKKQIPIVALVGRTNVGKSSLFNKMLEKPKALVSTIPGTTRDRNEGECLWRGRIVRIVDTGGLDVTDKDEMEANIVKQTQVAIKQADLILFVVDLKSDPLPQDQTLATQLSRQKTPVLVVGNKAETHAERLSIHNPQWQFPNLPSPIPISAIRGTGVGDLLDVIFDTLEEAHKPPVEPEELACPKIAVIGKPNVGKSTLLNSILGEERFITSPIAHTTREPNDTLITRDGEPYLFIDTAGMRKRGKVKKAGGLEAAAVKRNEHMVKIADITILVLDATEPIGTQEKTLAGFLKNSGSGVIVVINKWDLVEDKKTNTMNDYRAYIAASIPFLQWAPVLFVSALTKQRVKNIFDTIDEVVKNRSMEIPSAELEELLKDSMHRQKPIKGKGPSPPKVLGLKQIGTRPPTFELVMKAKRTDSLNESYIRFLTNQIHDRFGLRGTPVRIQVRIASAVSK